MRALPFAYWVASCPGQLCFIPSSLPPLYIWSDSSTSRKSSCEMDNSERWARIREAHDFLQSVRRQDGSIAPTFVHVEELLHRLLAEAVADSPPIQPPAGTQTTVVPPTPTQQSIPATPSPPPPPPTAGQAGH
ncbi:hypothetical protein SISSUDRAFT_1068120 [Sistotremastrum suecicum HHB10207 ss-3]|uniref:Uncharacterized protein n=1 Tax=Sistotremastrum suecicum HHB10207 ss-3 TaxID=1314776 RepID=A0A165WFB2_9AGAM|nr:hypothetical protein SISSUDRAFT_1068120 [Sistotremastrum suecicum HHB10207 ss-3]